MDQARINQDLTAEIERIKTQLSTIRLPEMPEPIVASYASSSLQTFTSGVEKVIDFETLVRDPLSLVKRPAVVASWRFIAPTAGDYAVAAAIMIENTNQWAAGETGGLNLWKNNSAPYRTLDRKDNFSGAVAQYMQLSGTTTIYLIKDEFIDVRLIQTSGATLALYQNVVSNYISVWRV